MIQSFSLPLIKSLGRRNSRLAILKASALILTMGVIASGVFLYNQTYAESIYPKVLVGGTKIGGMNKEEAKTAVQIRINELNSLGPEIIYEEETLKPTFEEMGVTFNADKIVNDAFSFGHTGTTWEKVKNNFTILTSGYTLEIKPEIDEAKLDSYLSQIATVVEKQPVNANLKIEGNEVVLVASVKGRGLDKLQLKEDLTVFINSNNSTGRIVIKTSDLEPQIKEDQTTGARDMALKYLATSPITVTFEDARFEAETSKIGSWIKFSEDTNKLVASANPSSFVNKIANQVEIKASDLEVEDGTGAVLNDGQDGRSVDSDLLTAQIKQALANGQPSSFALVTATVARGQKTIYPHSQPGRYPGKYIDINLSEQTLYAYEGSTLVNQFLISSGRRGFGTPTGEFSVYNKTAAQLMDGEDYYLPNVPWISWFSGDYSIHGTYWHSNFGTPMSHGCVNASTPDAKWIFDWNDIGTPIYIHE